MRSVSWIVLVGLGTSVLPGRGEAVLKIATAASCLVQTPSLLHTESVHITTCDVYTFRQHVNMHLTTH